jgi:hypothetical protein
MRSIVPFFIIMLASILTFAQGRSKLTWSASVNPSITFPANFSSSKEKVSGNEYQTHEQYADSVRTFETFKLSLGATVWMNYLINQKWTLQTGIGFNETGFTRQQKNIKVLDRVFPGVGTGMVLDQSNVERSIDYRFRYQYITLPVLFNYYGKRSGDFKWTYYFSTGIGFNYLLKHEIKAVLNDFVIDGENTFHLDSTGYEGTRFAVNLFVGARIEYKVDKTISVFGQPLITAYPLSISKTPMSVHPIGLTMNCGIVYLFDAKKDE